MQERITHNLEQEDQSTSRNWMKWLIISLTVLTWLVLTGVTIWLLSFLTSTLIILLIASLLAYALTPAVRFLQRYMSATFAVALIFLLLFLALSGLIYLIVRTSTAQIASLTHNIQMIVQQGGDAQLAPIGDLLNRLGIDQQELKQLGQQVVGQLQQAIRLLVPALSSTFSIFFNIILVATLSVYLLFNGERIIGWLRQNAPKSQRNRINFLLDTLGRVVGGYIRGQLLDSTIMSILTGVGLAIIGVPYAVFLGVFSFLFSFIPIVGAFATAALSILLALTQGWQQALITLVYVIALQLFEAQFIIPKVIGRSVGLHPLVALIALVGVGEILGPLGALLASPTAGLMQALLIAGWMAWRQRHPQEFTETVPEEIDAEVDRV